MPVSAHGRDGRSGATGIRTPDLCSAIAALYQLSYSPSAMLPSFTGFISMGDTIRGRMLFRTLPAAVPADPVRIARRPDGDGGQPCPAEVGGCGRGPVVACGPGLTRRVSRQAGCYVWTASTGTRRSSSSSRNRRERITNRRPSGISREKLAPRPSLTSSVNCMCFQYSN